MMLPGSALLALVTIISTSATPPVTITPGPHRARPQEIGLCWLVRLVCPWFASASEQGTP